jgi:toxin-antitoxin system PIN domain toxin
VTLGLRSLLDVNVVVALLDRDHIHHDWARTWLEREIQHGWASCPITQNGVVRVMSQPRYPNRVTTAEAIDLLSAATRAPHHAYWPCDVSVVDTQVVDGSYLHGPRQVTDVYLLALATSKGGRFVTFDGAVPLEAVRGARAANLVVL